MCCLRCLLAALLLQGPGNSFVVCEGTSGGATDRLQPGFQLLLVMDRYPAEQAKVANYLNASIAMVSQRQMELAVLITQPFQTIDETYRQVCEALDSGTNFVISASKNLDVVSGVHKAMDVSHVPTIQVDYGPWFVERLKKFGITLSTMSRRVSTENALSSDEVISETNYVRVVDPSVSMLNVLFDVVHALNMSKLAIIHDGLFEMDYRSWQLIRQLPVELSVVSSRSLSSDRIIQNHMNIMRIRGIKFVIVMSSTPFAEKFAIAVRREMESTSASKILFFFMTKDVAPFQCENCIRTDALWIRPDLGEERHFTRIRDFKEFLRQSDNIHLNELLTQENEVEAAFYLDMAYIAWNVIVHMNRSFETYPIFGCENNTLTAAENRTITLTEVLKSNAFEQIGPQGGYGPYITFDTGHMYQDIEMKIVRIHFDDKKTTRMMKIQIARHFEVGNWTASAGIVATHDSLLVDVNKLNHYRVAVVVQPPFIESVMNAEGVEEFVGYCIDLINRLKELVNFTYEIYEVKDKTFGVLSQGEWSGLIRELITGNADIALAPLSVLSEREDVVDFTVPYYDMVGTSILMKKTIPHYSLFKFMTVLELPVWCCIVVAFFYTSLLLWLFDRYSPYSYTNNKLKYANVVGQQSTSFERTPKQFTLKECFWFCITSLTPHGGGEGPKNVSGRVIASAWWLFGFIIIASYTANLAAFLTVTRSDATISSLDELSKQYKVQYAPVKGTVSEAYFKRMSDMEAKFTEIWRHILSNTSMSERDRAMLAVWDFPNSDKYTNMWRYMQQAGLPDTTQEAIERVKQSTSSTEGFAFIGDAAEISFAELTDCSVQKIGDEFNKKPYAIAVQQGSHLKDQLSTAILKLLYHRDLEQLKEQWFAKNPKRKNCPKPLEESDGISIRNIGGVFIIISTGIGLSAMILCFEYYFSIDKHYGAAPTYAVSGNCKTSHSVLASNNDRNSFHRNNRVTPNREEATTARRNIRKFPDNGEYIASGIYSYKL